MANPNQYFLLADHIKLSLLERLRAISLNIEPTSQDGHISRSLDSLREGVENVTRERIRLHDTGDTAASLALQETERNLQTQYNELTAQFRGTPTDTTAATIAHPNDPSLSADFARASQPPRGTSTSSLLKKSLRGASSPLATASPKSVRFSDAPLVADEEDEARNALFPYRDDPTSGPPDQSHLDNQQIHEYHARVMEEQDETLDRLGESIGRQRELSIQIGDELDEHVQMLDAVDGHVDRHATTLNKARKNLGTVARKARDNMQLTVILILIIILVLLIIILK
ncbi:Snare-domain-containing protein [Venustampulla echinocandica]|uniref:Snare-domain-containing protein n=1 Tax=Venustampulla echinocandica TaxID=2656787 RepID=A0A370TPB7_9HELO|nr:Snare-domain-containing protein [Venustampulla echinocandica]RDL37348.1 Snare-domain-containing protein [Venustampulla echinocandica]